MRYILSKNGALFVIAFFEQGSRVTRNPQRTVTEMSLTEIENPIMAECAACQKPYKVRGLSGKQLAPVPSVLCRACRTERDREQVRLRVAKHRANRAKSKPAASPVTKSVTSSVTGRVTEAGF